MMRVSKSNKVCGYVNAKRYLTKLQGKLSTREQELLPLKREVTEAQADVIARRAKMTGGQIGEAERIMRDAPEGGAGDTPGV